MRDDKHNAVVQYSTVQYSTVQYSTVQYSTVQCNESYLSHIKLDTMRVRTKACLYTCVHPSSESERMLPGVCTVDVSLPRSSTRRGATPALRTA